MTKLLAYSLILFTAAAEAKGSQPLLESFQTFATRDLVMFGAPKDTVLSFGESAQGYFVMAGKVILGTAVTYERCSAKVDKEDLKLTCYEGITASMDVCKLEPSVCQKENIKQKLRELNIDPNVARGDSMRGIGQQIYNPYMNSLTKLAKEHASARKAIAQAMSLNGCSSVELGDIAGQTTYLDQNPLADDDTKEVFEGARNRWRAIMKCRDASASVYLDVVMSIEQGKMHLNLVPIKAVEAGKVLIEVAEPNLGPKS